MRHLRPLLALGLALAAPVALLAQELTPEACVVERDGAPLADLPVDLGSGFVAQYFHPGASDLVPDGFVMIAECASATRLVAGLPLTETGRRTPEDVLTVMRAALASDEAQTGQQIASALTLIGAPAQLRSAESETCGCAAYYPEAQGDKAPWEETQ
jgi:hypothetical protein